MRAVNVVMNRRNISRLNSNQKTALVQAVDSAKTELITMQIVPFDTGTTQNRATYVDESNMDRGKVDLVSDTPYAKHIYFKPGLNFQTVNNPNAQAYWFEPFITGVHKDFIKKAFGVRLRALNART